MLPRRTEPKMCPLCGSEAVSRILCDTLLNAHFQGIHCPSEGVAAYHCGRSHVFLTLRDDFRWGTPDISPIPSEPEVQLETVTHGKLFQNSIGQKIVACGAFFNNLLLTRRRQIQSLNLAR